MTIFKVTKLFGTYDVTIDISEDTVILLGENGMGKTTLLKMLRHIASGDFYALTRFPFDKITLRGEGKKVDIKYTDLFPERQAFLRFALKEGNVDAAVLEAIKLSGQEAPSGDVAEDDWRNFLSATLTGIEEVEYCSRLADIYRNTGESGYMLMHEKQQTDKLKAKLDKLLFEGMFLLSPICRKNRGGVLSAKIADILGFSPTSSTGYGTSLYVSLVKAIHFSAAGGVKLDNSYNRYFQPQNVELSGDESTFKHLMGGYIGNCSFEQDVRRIKDLYSDLSSSTKKCRVTANAVFTGLDSGSLPISAILSEHFYSEDDIVDINERAANYFLPLLGQNRVPHDQSDPHVQKLILDNSEFIRDYIAPSLIEGSVFDALLKEERAMSGAEFVSDNLIDAFAEFIKCEKEYILSLKPQIIKNFDKTLSKFFFGKKVCSTPAGLRIYDSRGHRLDLSMLSSGERSLISMMTYAHFFEGCTLIIDEPELSLSIVWQSWLLPEIIEAGYVSRLIVATHSPYIAEDEMLHDFVKTLEVREVK